MCVLPCIEEAIAVRSLRLHSLGILLAILPAASLAPAQNQNKPASACPDLRSLTNNELTIASAVMMAPSDNAPEHCRVRGQVFPRWASK